MPQIITLNELKSITKERVKNESTTLGYILKTASEKKTKNNIFLSYSSQDKEVLPAVIEILENHNGGVYTDIGDDKLPTNTSVETAKILKDTIKRLPRMVVFVTTNSKDSKWIPWELGLGDGAKSNYDIAIFPSADKAYDTAWLEQEYLGLYQRIIFHRFKGTSQNIWMVYNSENNSGIPLNDWLDTNPSRGIL